MKDPENLVAGVHPGGFTDIYEVRILICYLLHSVSEPLSKDQLNDIFQSTHMVNYFAFSDALAQLLGDKQIIALKSEDDTYYKLTQLGIDTANLLQNHLPRSVRDRVVTAALELLSKQKKERENEVMVEELENGYNVTFIIHDTDFDLMQFSMYLPDEMQLELVKKRFLENPAEFYTHVVAYLIGLEP
ncbi:MAG: DUF4364 family protein [Massiliimalia sp.]